MPSRRDFLHGLLSTLRFMAESHFRIQIRNMCFAGDASHTVDEDVATWPCSNAPVPASNESCHGLLPARLLDAAAPLSRGNGEPCHLIVAGGAVGERDRKAD